MNKGIIEFSQQAVTLKYLKIKPGQYQTWCRVSMETIFSSWVKVSISFFFKYALELFDKNYLFVVLLNSDQLLKAD